MKSPRLEFIIIGRILQPMTIASTGWHKFMDY